MRVNKGSLLAIAMLTMAIGAAPAHAKLVSFNFTYTPFKPGIGPDHLTLDVTGFLDDSQITGVGAEFVTLDHLDVIITKGTLSLTAHFANNETGIYPGNPAPKRFAGLQRVPYFVEFRSGVLHAGLDGLQRNSGLGIDGLRFITNSPGGPHSFVGFGNVAQSPFPGECCIWDQGRLVQPIDTTLTIVPETPTLTLFGVGLLVLTLFSVGLLVSHGSRWRKNRNSIHSRA